MHCLSKRWNSTLGNLFGFNGYDISGGHISGGHFNPAVTLGVWLRVRCHSTILRGSPRLSRRQRDSAASQRRCFTTET
nr:aquaporin [Methylacidiphilum sp. Yel]